MQVRPSAEAGAGDFDFGRYAAVLAALLITISATPMAHGAEPAIAATASARGAEPAISAKARGRATEPTVRSYKIGPQPVVSALKAFATQSDLQMIFSEADVGSATTAGVSGKHSAREALSMLLQKTGLEFEITVNNVVVVRKAASQPQASAHPPVSVHTKDPLSQPADAGGPVRLAQAQHLRDAPNREDEQPSSDTLEEVIVTGSHIRGVHNDTEPMLTLDRQYIERSGYSNMMQLAQSLPMNFTGGYSGSSETAGFGDSPYHVQNLNRGTGFNLHGLGSVATLTLIDGRRVAPAAQGQFVDISTIPLTAVERVEILTDGASAIYGADAVAGVVNIILRKDFSGAETSLDLGAATRGGTSEERLSQTLGQRWSGGNALLVAEVSKRDPLDARDRDYIVEAGGTPLAGPTWLLPKRITESMVFNVNQSLPDRFDLASTVMYAHEAVSEAQTYPDGPDAPTSTLSTHQPVTDKWSALLAIGYQPFGDWRFEAEGLFSRMQTVTGFHDIDLPSQELQTLIDDYRDKFDLWSADLEADGSLVTLPSGKVRLAAGLSFREDTLHSDREWVFPPRGYQLRAQDRRQVSSAFTELFIPLVAKEQNFSWARRIELSAAARYDHYSDFGHTVDPKFGVVWSPSDRLDIRASYGSSFRAPSVAEKALVTRGVQISNSLVDAPGGGEVPIFFLIGSAPLTAEKSKNLSVGFTLRPLSGAELSVNYFNIDYTGRISSPPFEQNMLLERSKFGSLISELPDDAAAQAYLDSRIASGDLYLDLLGTGAAGVRYLFDWRQQNAARTRMDGVDLNAQYELRRTWDTYDFGMDLTYIAKLDTALLSDTTSFSDVNAFERPVRTRVRAMATWLRAGWNSTVALNYVNAYTNSSVDPAIPVKAWTTVDLNLSYDLGTRSPSSALAGTRVSLSVTNVFDVNPPRTTDPLFNMGYDVFNADALGRYVIARCTKRW